MSLDVVGGQRLFEPADVGGLVMAGAADRLVDVEGLISVGENLEVGAARSASSRSTSSRIGRPTLTLEPPG